MSACSAGHTWEILTNAVEPVAIICGECGKQGAVTFPDPPRPHPYYTSASGTCSYCDGDIADPWHVNEKAAMLAGAVERLKLPARADSYEELEARRDALRTPKNAPPPSNEDDGA